MGFFSDIANTVSKGTYDAAEWFSNTSAGKTLGKTIDNFFGDDTNKATPKSTQRKQQAREYNALNNVGVKVPDMLKQSGNSMIITNPNYIKQNDYDITGYLPEGGTLAVVNNQNTGGTWISKYGYAEAHAPGLKDGTVIRVFNDGTYDRMDVSNASEDWIEQYNKFCEGYKEARSEYRKAVRFQNLALNGYESVQVGTDNTTGKTDSFFDLINNLRIGADNVEQANKGELLSFEDWKATMNQDWIKTADPEMIQYSYNIYKANYEKEPSLAEKFAPERILDAGGALTLAEGLLDEKAVASVKDYAYTKQWFQFILDRTDKVESYKELYKKNPDAARDLLLEDTSISDRKRQYIAYMLVQDGGDDKELKDYVVKGALNTFQDLGESMDWLSNPVKGTVGYLDSLDGKSWTGITNVSDTWDETMKAAYRASWENEGRQAYNYDTGFVPFDLFLEIISDPEFAVTKASRLFDKQLAKELGTTELTKKHGILNKLFGESEWSKMLAESETPYDLGEALGKRMPNNTEAFHKIITDYDDYYNGLMLSHSLKDTLAIKNSVDAFMAIGSTNGIPWALKHILPIAWKGGNLVFRAGEMTQEESKAYQHMIAGYSDAMGKTGSDIKLNNVVEFTDNVNVNFAAIRNYLLKTDPETYTKAGKDIIKLDEKQKIALFAQAYNNSVADIHNLLSKDRAALKRYISTTDLEPTDIIHSTLIKHSDEILNNIASGKSVQEMLVEFLIEDAGENNLEVQRLTAIRSLFETQQTEFGTMYLTKYALRRDALDAARILHIEDSELCKILEIVQDTGTYQFKLFDAPEFTKEAYDTISRVSRDNTLVSEANDAINASTFKNSFKVIDNGEKVNASEIGTVYTPKLKDEIVTDAIQNNRFYNTVISSFTERDENTIIFYNILNSADPRIFKSGVRRTIEEMLETKYAVKAYHYFCDSIEASKAIPEDLKPIIKDKLFSDSLNSSCNAVFRHEGYDKINAYRVESKARALTRKLVQETISYDAAASQVDKFKELGCNTKDPLANVKAIQKVIDERPEALLRKDMTVYVPYSIRFNSDGAVETVAVKSGDNVDVFNLLNADGTANDDAIAALDNHVLTLRADIGHSSQRVQFVGMNNHISGFDSDAAAQAFFSAHKAQAGNVLTQGSIDIADNLRLAKYQIIPMTEAAAQELTTMFKNSINDWLESRVFTISTLDELPAFSIKPPTYNDFNRWYTNMSLDYKELDQIGFGGNAELMFNDMKSTIETMRDAETHLMHEVGRLQLDKASDYWEAIKNMPKEIGFKKAYDAAILNEYCDKVFIDGLNFGQAESLYKIIRQVDTDAKSYDTLFCSTFKKDIDDMYRTMKEYAFNNRTVADRLGIDYDTLTHLMDNRNSNWHNTNTTKRKVAYMQAIWDKLDNQEKLQLATKEFSMCLGDPAHTLKYHTEYFNPNQVLNGSIDNASSKWNTERRLANEYTKMQELMTDINAMEEVRMRNKELVGELDPVYIQYRNKLRESHNQLLDTIRSMFEFTTKPYETAKELEITSPKTGKRIETLLSFGDPTFEARLDRMNPYEKFWYTGAHQPTLYKDLNLGLQEAQIYIYNGQLRALSSMTREQFDIYMLYNSAAGRAIVDTTTFDALDVENFKRFVNETLGDEYKQKYNFEEYTKGVYRFSIDTDELLELRNAVPYQRIDFNVLTHGATKGHDITQNGASVLKMYQAFTDFNDSTYSFMSFMPNNKATITMLNQKYFPDKVMDKVLSPKDLVGDYCCGYIGNIKNLLGTEDIHSFMSGNPLTNLINSFNRVVVKTDNLWLLNSIIYKDNKFKVLSNADCAKTMTNIKDKGYRIIAPKLNGEVRDITELSVAQLKSYKNVAVLRADEVQALMNKTREMADNLNTSKLHSMVKAIREWEYKYYLKWMLETTPFPGLNNIKDSTVKAILAEGAEIIPYYAKVNDLINRSRKPLYELTKRAEAGEFALNSATIDALAKYGWKYDITPDELKLVLAFKDSVISSIDSGQSVLLPRARDMVFPKRVDAEGNVIKNAEGKAKHRVDVFGFNKWLFEAPEVYNRFAIYLKTIDDTGNIGKAYEAVKLSQFEYAKGKINTALDIVKPFSTFQLYNIKFWLCDIWFKEGAPRRLGHLADVFNNSYDNDPQQDYFWSEDMAELRAMIDTCNFPVDTDEFNEVKTYNKFKDFTGSGTSTAQQNGWIKFRDSDTLWFKSGISWLDAYTGLESYSFGLGDDLWSPIKITQKLAQLYTDKDMRNSLDTKLLEDIALAENGDVSQLVSDFGYEVVSYLPFATTLYYMGESIVRNQEYAERMNKSTLWRLAGCLPGIFAPAREYDYQRNDRWYERPVGFDWYNQSKHYRDTHRFVPGVSYVPAWIYKDPATYINTVGRMQQILGGKDGAYEFMQQGGGFWFTVDNGVYKLHNYKLMIGDEETRLALKDSLMHKFGWSEEAAEYLLDQWGEPVWKNKGKKNLKNSLTYSGGSLRSVDNTSYLIGKTRGSLPHNLIKRFKAHTGVRKIYPPARSAQPHFNNNPLGLRLSAGKNVKYSTFTTRRKAMGHDPQMFSRQYQTTVRWHHRQRDIYKDNYAKYGASRMAMEQNLRNYSNRSITEMRRTNQNIRYADIHRHTHW